MMRSTNAPPDVLVVGAGITGVSAALDLAKHGASVEIIDSYWPAAMASGWTLAGVRQSGRHPAELPLARQAVALWPTLNERLHAETGYRQGGNLRLARTEDEVEAIRALVTDQKEAGLDLTFLNDLQSIREICPGLSEQVLAASFCPTDGHADPEMTVAAYVKRLQEMGVRMSWGETMTGLTTTGDRVIEAITDERRIPAGAVLLAAGFLVNDLLEALGCAIPLRRPIVTVLRSAFCAPMLTPVLGTAIADLAARQEVSGRLRVTSGAEAWDGALRQEAGRPVIRPSMHSVQNTIAKIATVLPAFAELEVEQVWAGALDLTPDALPVIDAVPGYSNLVVAAGFSGHGFGIGPVTGPLAAQVLSGRPTDHDLTPFSFNRFSVAPQTQAPLTLHG